MLSGSGWRRSARRSPKAKAAHRGAPLQSAVRTAVATIGTTFRDIAPRIAASSRDVVHRMETARDQRRAAEKAEHSEWEHQDAAARAADAFRAGDYRRVVSLLAPLEASLTPAEKKKLALARKYL